MKIIFTGSSSFTGYWFIKTLSEAGHNVIATFKGNIERYTDIRKSRVAELTEMVPCVFNCAFGSEAFIRLIEKEAGSICFVITTRKQPIIKAPTSMC